MEELEIANLRNEQLSLCIGMTFGQLSGLLNNIKGGEMTTETIYKELLDITTAASLQVHKLFYKNNKPD